MGLQDKQKPAPGGLSITISWLLFLGNAFVKSYTLNTIS